MAITVKKKKLTVKTVRAKSAAAEGSEDSAGAESAASAAPAGAAARAAPSAPGVKPASYTLAGVFAIITVCMFIALIILQVLEWTFYQDAFPRPMMPGTGAAAGAAYTPPAGDAVTPIEPLTGETPAAEPEELGN